ncbi:hypothetical protein [Cognatiyoonia sp.]|uniref:hypothetical protein n=1 Tax=Cognatiyoonia sp. TaxID=2211652 RepID=UPI003F69CC80
MFALLGLIGFALSALMFNNFEDDDIVENNAANQKGVDGIGPIASLDTFLPEETIEGSEDTRNMIFAGESDVDITTGAADD